MSQWTHIKGCIELSGRAAVIETDKKTGEKTYYLPYPDKQLKLTAPKPCFTDIDDPEHEVQECGIKYDLQVYCLPRCQEFVDKAMQLLPSGEHNLINYITHQPEGRFSLSTGKIPSYLSEIFKKRIIAQYQASEGYPITWEDIQAFYNIKADWAEFANEFTLTISDNLRDCTGEELLVALEKVFSSLKADGINVYSGILDWTDEWSKFKYRCVTSFDNISFQIYEFDTGKTVAKKEYHSIWNPDLREFEDKVEQTDNWNEFISKELYGQESSN